MSSLSSRTLGVLSSNCGGMSSTISACLNAKTLSELFMLMLAIVVARVGGRSTELCRLGFDWRNGPVRIFDTIVKWLDWERNERKREREKREKEEEKGTRKDETTTQRSRDAFISLLFLPKVTPRELPLFFFCRIQIWRRRKKSKKERKVKKYIN